MVGASSLGRLGSRTLDQPPSPGLNHHSDHPDGNQQRQEDAEEGERQPNQQREEKQRQEEKDGIRIGKRYQQHKKQSKQQQSKQQSKQQQQDGGANHQPPKPDLSASALEPLPVFERRLQEVHDDLGEGEGVTALMRASRAAEEAALSIKAAAAGGTDGGSGSSTDGAVGSSMSLGASAAAWLVADEAEDTRLLSLSGLLANQPTSPDGRVRRDLFGASLDFVAALCEASRCLARFPQVGGAGREAGTDKEHAGKPDASPLIPSTA
jgi:hypothetical protein